MKKILALIALVALAAFGFGQYTKSQVLSEVQTILADPNNEITATATKTDYSFLSNTLTFTGLTAQTDGLILFTADKLIITGYSVESIDAASGDYPLVADEIYFENFNTPDNVAHIQNFSVKGWKQNLALLSDAIHKEDFQQLALRALTFEIDEILVNGLKLEEGMNFDQFMIKSNKNGTYGLSFDKLIFDDGYTHLSIDEIDVENAPTLNDEALAEIVNAVILAEYDMSSLEESLSSMIYSHMNTTENQKLSLKNVSVSDKYDGTYFTFKEYLQTTKNAGTESTFMMDDLSILNVLDSEMQEAMKLETIVLDMNGDIKMNKEMTTLDMNAITQIEDFVDFTIDMDLIFPISYLEFIDALANEDFMTMLTMFETVVNDFSIDVEDKGMTPRFLMLAKYEAHNFAEQDLSIDELISYAQKEVVYFEEEMYYMGVPQEFAMELSSALQKSIEIPGKIKLEVITKGASIDALSNALMTGENFPLGVIYTAGEKSSKQLVEELSK